MDTEQLLKEALNLSDYQILVYLSLLEKTGTAGQLFRRLNINRATLYRVLEELTSLNLIIRKQIKARMFFEALHPEALNELYDKRRISFEEKGRALERVVHELLRKATAQPTDASISIEKGIHAHFRKMKLFASCKEKLLRLKVSSDSSIYEYQNYPESGDYSTFQREFTRELIAKEIHTKLLTTAALGPKQKNYNVSDPEQLKEARIFPDDILPNISFAVFDDYVIFTERHGNPESMVIITIRNELTATFMKTLFDFIFDRSIVSYKQLPIPTFQSNENAIMPVLGIGSSGIGGYWNGLHPNIDDVSDIDQIRHAMSKGSNYIDACLLYGEGHTVEVISKAIRNVPRNDLFINAKLTRVNNKVLQSIKEVEEQCNRYLKILGTEYVDQFQIHSAKSLGNVPQHEVIEKIGELITAGKVKHWGVSNYSKTELTKIQGIIKEPLHSNEIPFGVFFRDYEKDGTIEYLNKQGITTIAYFTIRKGGLLVDQFFGTEQDSLLQKLATKYQKTATQIAINWVIHHPKTLALIKATNGTHVNENFGSIGWEMEKGDYELITKL